MPTVRDVPAFPDRALNPGESWTAEGHEAHDLRDGFALETPYKVPFIAQYTYTGRDRDSGLYIIEVRYSMQMDSPPVREPVAGDYPVRTMGYSFETIYWDNDKGAIELHRGVFNLYHILPRKPLRVHRDSPCGGYGF